MMNIPLMRVSFTEEDLKAVQEVLESGMLVQGKQVLKLEDTFAKYAGSKNAIAVSNGTASLHLMLLANQIGPGDEVIIPALSYVATANVVEIVGAKPVFVDTKADTFNIDISQIEEKISPKTKAIMPVNEFGLCADLEEIQAICKKHDLILLEDSACALGAKLNDQHSGTFGQSGSFSFHPRKAITSGEGGMLITDDDDLANNFRTLRNHGIDPKSNSFAQAGLNYRMTDFQAALLSNQFKRFDQQLEEKQKLAQIYLKEINSPKIRLPKEETGKLHSWQTFHVVLDESIDRAQMIQKLKAKGIGSNYGAQCIPEVEFYKNKYKTDCKKEFPNALRAFEHGLALPLFSGLKSEEISYIAAEINKF